ncbi:MAG TPA: hypothetical protein VN922_19605 [Bacteroidia bacterium]|nr:hypothetical protein [Bacteroidia bacterium]
MLSDIEDKILKNKRQFYPTGRAFKMPFGGLLEMLHKALAVSEAQAYTDALSILNAILPDNANFTADDASEWEYRLGLITNPLVPLPDRKAAIQRKLNYPSGNPAKGNYLYVQEQLQAANFNVYVYENKFPDGFGGFITKTPFQITGDSSLLSDVEHGEIEHGEAQHGKWYNNKVVNHIDETLDLTFDVGNSMKSTFYISGNPITSYANVDVNRKDEFRQLILKLKPAQTVAFLLVNYV